MNLITNFNLSDNQNGQSLYSSQLYGTFFSIFGIVETEQKGNGYLISSLKLKLINYKGVLNLEITNAELVSSKLVLDEIIQWSLSVEVQAKATTKNDEVLFTVKDDKGNPFTSKDGLVLKKGTSIIFRRFLKPIHLDSNNQTRAQANGVFDSEFYYREGVFDDHTAKKSDKRFLAKLWDERPRVHEEVAAQGGFMCPYAWILIL